MAAGSDRPAVRPLGGRRCLYWLVGIGTDHWRSLSRQVLGGVLVAAAFPLLVLERSYAGLSVEMLPEAPQLERLLRVPLTACLGLGISMVLVSLGFGWGFWIERATSLLIFITALELILRSLAMCFIPFAPIERLRTVADSSMAGLLRLSVPNFQAFNIAVRQQFGIDLSRSWALAFIRRASLPIMMGLGLMAWGITGITALGLNQRAVYERFGSPVAVFGPGLHVHLPWPMGVMREVELGVVHDIPIAISPTGDPTQFSQPSAGVDQQQQLVGAEAPAPPSTDRLWNASHPAEQTYLIASEASGQQSFQVADADLRVVYRVGLSDAAALDFAYRVADPEVFIRAAAGQILVKHFSRYTLLDVLGQNRETFANEFRTALQNQLDRMSSGIEVIAVVIEAIHPPPGAAAAYHNVQAAEILANVEIAVQRADAIRYRQNGRTRGDGRTQQGDRGSHRASRSGQQRERAVRCRSQGMAAGQSGFSAGATVRAPCQRPRQIGVDRDRPPLEQPECADHRSAELQCQRQ